jgi:MoxR-like ATPase
MQEQVLTIRVDESVIDYMLAIVEKTRSHEGLALGVSPRGSQALYRSSQALAMIEGRRFVTPDDVKRLVIPVCAHRVVVQTRKVLGRASDAAAKILDEILMQVDVPL